MVVSTYPSARKRVNASPRLASAAVVDWEHGREPVQGTKRSGCAVTGFNTEAMVTGFLPTVHCRVLRCAGFNNHMGARHERERSNSRLPMPFCASHFDCHAYHSLLAAPMASCLTPKPVVLQMKTGKRWAGR